MSTSVMQGFPVRFSWGRRQRMTVRGEERVMTVFGAMGVWIGLELAVVGLVVGHFLT